MNFSRFYLYRNAFSLHRIDFVSNDRTPGLEFYGEQGIEGIHSEFNTQSQHFDHVKKKDTRLRQILVNHHIATSPELAGKAPKPKERNLKRKANE